MKLRTMQVSYEELGMTNSFKDLVRLRMCCQSGSDEKHLQKPRCNVFVKKMLSFYHDTIRHGNLHPLTGRTQEHPPVRL